MKRCPVCHNQFDADLTHCKFDGHQLAANLAQPATDQAASDVQPLADLLGRQAPLEIDRAVRLAISISEALGKLHSAGRIVGALHPQDILITACGQPQERALSIKPSAPDLLASEKDLESVAAYVSPEAAQQQEKDARTDIYSLGAILYEMLAGQPPFKASSPAAVVIKQILEHPRPLREIRPELSSELQAVIFRALEKEKPARQQSLEQLKRELEEALSPSSRTSFSTMSSAAPGTGQTGQDMCLGLLLNERYLIEKKLGASGFGVVYLARDVKLISRPVVIKVLSEDTDHGLSEWSKRRFRHEIEALARLNHPGVVNILDFGEMPGGKPYFIEQFVDGANLRSIIKAAGMDFAQAANLIRQVGQALSAAHSKGIYHGDLKPQNIRLQALDEGEQQVKLINFGVGQLIDVVVGTPGYMAPEQWRGEKTEASDIYALGVIAYEMLTGRRPFEADSALHFYELQQAGVKVPPAVLCPGLSPGAQAAILKALAFSPQDRYQRARDFSEELARALTVLPASEAPTLRAAPTATLSTRAADLEIASPTLSQPAMSLPAPGRAPGSRGITVALLGAVITVSIALAFLSLYFSTKAPRSAPPMVGIEPPQSTPPLSGTPPTTPTAAPTPSLSETPAQSTIIVVILILGAAVGAVVVILLRRRRRAAAQEPLALENPPSLPTERGIPEPPPSTPYPVVYNTAVDTGALREESVTTRPALQRATQEQTRRCPVCQKEYPDTLRFCTEDGTRLIMPSLHEAPTLTAQKQCPKCGAEYPAKKRFCRFDGEALVEIVPELAPTAEPAEIEPFLIGQYRCFAQLGEGGMGVVYKAHHIHLERLSAVKVLLPQTAILPDAVKMFRREARLASSINHPNSVIIYDYGEVGAKLFYLAMEFIQGQTLAELLQPHGQPACPLPLPRALNIIRQICDALDTAHQAGIIHRDLKPQNVMVCAKANRPDVVKVVDFGIARSLAIQSEYQTQRGTVIGTPAYMSPEQADADPEIDERSDIFSLGVMVYQMLSGVLPFPTAGLTPRQQANRRATLSAPPLPLSKTRPDLGLPSALDLALSHALEPDRQQRTQSALQFMEELEQAARA